MFQELEWFIVPLPLGLLFPRCGSSISNRPVSLTSSPVLCSCVNRLLKITHTSWLVSSPRDHLCNLCHRKSGKACGSWHCLRGERRKMMRSFMKMWEKFTQIHGPIPSVGSGIVPPCSFSFCQNQYNELVALIWPIYVSASDCMLVTLVVLQDLERASESSKYGEYVQENVSTEFCWLIDWWLYSLFEGIGNLFSSIYRELPCRDRNFAGALHSYCALSFNLHHILRSTLFLFLFCKWGELWEVKTGWG